MRIRGAGTAHIRRIGRVRVTAALASQPPFPVQAMAIEQDTALLLDDTTGLREPPEDYPRLITRMASPRPVRPGSVLVRGGTPLRLLAVVHDFDQDPSWRVSWVQSALVSIFRIAARRNLHAVGLPPLGTRHGRLSARAFMSLLRDILGEGEASCPRRLWLVLPEEGAEAVLEALDP
jgi:hypothetical protein